MTKRKPKEGPKGKNRSIPTEITDAQWTVIEERASYGCTHDEIAQYLGVTKRTLYAPHLRERFERLTKMALAQRRYLLRKARIDAAIEKPLSITAIWVDKNMLGWTDKQQVTTAPSAYEGVQDATDRLLEMLDKIEANRAQPKAE